MQWSKEHQGVCALKAGQQGKRQIRLALYFSSPHLRRNEVSVWCEFLLRKNTVIEKRLWKPFQQHTTLVWLYTHRKYSFIIHQLHAYTVFLSKTPLSSLIPFPHHKIPSSQVLLLGLGESNSPPCVSFNCLQLFWEGLVEGCNFYTSAEAQVWMPQRICLWLLHTLITHKTPSFVFGSVVILKFPFSFPWRIEYTALEWGVPGKSWSWTVILRISTSILFSSTSVVYWGKMLCNYTTVPLTKWFLYLKSYLKNAIWR